jgi:hypothetical protein
MPRRDDARVGEVGILRQYRLELRDDGVHVARHDVGGVEAAVHVHVRPGPQLREVGEDVEALDVDVRQRMVANVLPLGELSLGQDDEHDPRREAALGQVGPLGRVAPRPILVVELDGGEVIGLEVGDPVAGLGADDGPSLDAEDVAGAEERHAAGHVDGGVAAAVDLRSAQREMDVHRRPRSVGGAADLVRQSEPQPREKRVGAQWCGHAALSTLGMTWMTSARLGSRATSARRKSRAPASLENDAVSGL